ncbi:hypothetical protein BDIM_22770 [Brevundimonas diminuta ATCC 11568]|nr:hypothetical protein BDIM_22770 [Brevundimonas diminuta ATCC 11568]
MENSTTGCGARTGGELVHEGGHINGAPLHSPDQVVEAKRQ